MTSLPQQFLATVATAPNVMELRRLDIPEIGDDEAIVRIEATGICGTDDMMNTDSSTARLLMVVERLLEK